VHQSNSELQQLCAKPVQDYMQLVMYTTALWGRITRKLAKILTLLVLFETHILNNTKKKISRISKKFNETNVTEEELSCSLSVLLLYSESLGFITDAEVLALALAPNIIEGETSKRQGLLREVILLISSVVPLMKRSQDPTLTTAFALNPDWSILPITFLYNVL
jgi:hypothetical protein